MGHHQNQGLIEYCVYVITYTHVYIDIHTCMDINRHTHTHTHTHHTDIDTLKAFIYILNMLTVISLVIYIVGYCTKISYHIIDNHWRRYHYTDKGP